MKAITKIANKSNRGKKLLVALIIMICVLSSVAYADPIDNATGYINQRLGTIFICIVSFFIVKNLAKNATSKLIGFILIAAVAAIFIYKPDLFGNLADWAYNIIF